jgi:menaquinone-specific isochorismate synthase
MKDDERTGSAGVPPAVARASRSRSEDLIIRNRGHLPHWEKDGATYFITFRLADSLPRAVLDRIESERQSIAKTAKQLDRNLSPDECRKILSLSTPAIEQYLDNGAGACHLRNPVIAEQANTVLGTRGTFWQRAYYDHLVRGDEEFEPAVRYVVENPVKANLKPWKSVWASKVGACPAAAEDGGASKARP